MKTILVPTDFSEAAENAVNYAAEMGARMKVKIVLFHAFHIPVVTTEVPVIMPGIDELEREFMADLKKTERRLHLRYGKDLAVECVCKCGFAVDEISSYVEAHKTDLIVMGMRGAGYLTEKLIGSITTTMMQKAKCPVLAIDKAVMFKSIKKIAFACDYEGTDNGKTLEPLKQIVKIFKSHVYVLNVLREPASVSSVSRAVPGYANLEDSLEGVEHTFHYLENEDIVEGINMFVKERKMDMVVMIPRKHTILKNIFSEPNTKRMAFHSHVPLLALH